MSRGRGRGKSSASTIANSLGLQRHEVPLLQQTSASITAQPLFPPMDKRPLPLNMSEDIEYMAELNQELMTRFNESSHFITVQSDTKDIKRYTDKYKPQKEKSWEPDSWSRIPAELCWRTSKRKHPSFPSLPSKKPRISQSKAVDAKFQELEQKEKKRVEETEQGKDIEKKGNEEDEEDKGAEEEELLSDDDYQEEDNDYIQSYFDNGEEYLDASDDNLDEDAVY